jgi:AcrR family transcriptional regulator
MWIPDRSPAKSTAKTKGAGLSGRKQFDNDEIVDRATRAFWTHGYGGTSLNVLTEATGLARSSVYNAYRSKEDLFVVCLERYEATVAHHLLEGLISSTDPHDSVTELYRRALDRMGNRRNPPGCLITRTGSEGKELPKQVQRVVREAIQRQVDAVTANMSAAISAGRLPKDTNAAQLASTIVVVAQGLAVMHQAGFDLTTLRSVAAAHVESLFSRSP